MSGELRAALMRLDARDLELRAQAEEHAGAIRLLGIERARLDVERQALRSVLERAASREPRPLFIPLKAEFYAAFKAGTKTEELRRHGPRWNQQTCAVGRRVVLSRGYGRQHRLSGRVVRFTSAPAARFGRPDREAIAQIYGTLDIWIACIGIEVERGGA